MMNNEKNTIDDQIRAALEHFEQPYNAEHWHDMNARLDALMSADAAFDTSVRGHLANISAVPKADAWSKMAEKLDDLDAADSSFDASLRGRLADVAAVPKMGDWSKMAAVLDSFDDTESEFDDVLRRKLENIAAKHPNHWAMMNERLDREFTLRGKIVRYKVVEAALILLALFTVINTIDKNTEGSLLELKIKNEELKTATQNATDLKVDNGTLNNSASNNRVENAIAPAFKTTTPNATNNVKSFDNSTNWRLRSGIQYQNGQNKKQGGTNAIQNQQQNQQPSLTPTGQPIVDNSLINKWLPSALNPQNAQNTEGPALPSRAINFATNTTQNAQNTEGDVSQSHQINVATNVAQNAEVSVLPTTNFATQPLAEVVLPIDILQANLLENNQLNASPNIIKANTDKKAKWRLSTFGTAALDWVTTSFVDKDRVLNRQNQGVANYGVNALVGYKRGKVEVETGVMFNQKKYSIANVELITGTVVSRNATKIEKPQDLRLSIVSIPLNINVNLKEKRRLNVYAHAGVATNAIVDALDRREIIKPIDLTNNYGPAPQPSEIETATYSKGLINGGETKDNVFFTAQLGVGLEYKLTPKASLFLQPTASFMLNKESGIGSLNDRVRTFSIQGGAKWRL
jgi:hypothetical protein